MVFAFIGMIASSLERISDKVALNYRNLTFRHLLTISFTITFSLGLLLTPYLGAIDSEFWNLKFINLFGIEILVAFLMNILYFWSLKRVELCDVEQFGLLEGPITVVLAAVIFPSERSFIPIVLTLVATIMLVWSRTDEYHLRLEFKKSTLALVVSVLLVSVDFQFAKILLEHLSPVSYYVIRNGFLMILFWIFLKPRFNKIDKHAKRVIFANGLITFLVFISRFYSIQVLGIVQTTLIFLLAPVITIVSSKHILMEHVTKKKLFADAIIICCVIATLYIG